MSDGCSVIGDRFTAPERTLLAHQGVLDDSRIGEEFRACGLI